MTNYLILSLKHSEGKQPCFWRADDSGYTTIPFAAGVYTAEQVLNNPNYYNDGYNTLAIPLSNDGLESIGFSTQMDLNRVADLSKKVRIERGKEADKKGRV